MAPFVHSKRSLLLCLLLLAVPLGGCRSSRPDEDDRVHSDDSLMTGRFQRWKTAYNRTYATAAEERRRFLVSLSAQELVDCDTMDNGCTGGFPQIALSWIKLNGGITTEDDYPYNGIQGACHRSKLPRHAATISGFGRVAASNELSLMNAVARQPVAVRIKAGHPDFHHFRGDGVYHGSCGNTFNHVVAVVGYGCAGSQQRSQVLDRQELLGNHVGRQRLHPDLEASPWQARRLLRYRHETLFSRRLVCSGPSASINNYVSRS
ncbi:unnamed protein product [Urochloa humidicola]